MDLRQLQILRAGSFKNLMLMKARQRGTRAQLCFLKYIHERRDVGFPRFHTTWTNSGRPNGLRHGSANGGDQERSDERAARSNQ